MNKKKMKKKIKKLEKENEELFEKYVEFSTKYTMLLIKTKPMNLSFIKGEEE